jgi:hypothetical protein
LLGSGSRRQLRRTLEQRTGAPYLFPILLTALALAGGWWLKDAAPGLAGAVASPEVKVRAALAAFTSARLEDVYGHGSGGLAELSDLRLADVTVALEGEGDRARARVVAMAEGTGRVAWRGQVATLAYVGREAFTMRPCTFAGYCAEGEALAELRPVLRLLFRRLDAFNGRDAEAYGRLVAEGYRGAGGKAALLTRLREDLASGPPATLTVTAWQLRVDRDQVVVGEDELLTTPGRPPVALRARLTLVREAGRWVVADGLSGPERAPAPPPR